jgi:hypothetical protein
MANMVPRPTRNSRRPKYAVGRLRGRSGESRWCDLFSHFSYDVQKSRRGRHQSIRKGATMRRVPPAGVTGTALVAVRSVNAPRQGRIDGSRDDHGRCPPGSTRPTCRAAPASGQRSPAAPPRHRAGRRPAGARGERARVIASSPSTGSGRGCPHRHCGPTKSARTWSLQPLRHQAGRRPDIRIEVYPFNGDDGGDAVHGRRQLEWMRRLMPSPVTAVASHRSGRRPGPVKVAFQRSEVLSSAYPCPAGG